MKKIFEHMLTAFGERETATENNARRAPESYYEQQEQGREDDVNEARSFSYISSAPHDRPAIQMCSSR